MSSQVVQNSEEFRDANPDIVTLPGYFKSRGYATYGSGKIFHVDSTENDTGLSWDNHDRPLNPYQHLNGEMNSIDPMIHMLYE